jgi:chemotaxis signal transduction protein
MDRRALIVFTAASRRLALPLEDIQRVLPVPLLQPPAGAPAFVEGFFDFRGAPVAVVRIDRLLSLGDERLGVYAPLLLLKQSEPMVALHVGGVTGILKATAIDVQPIGRDETFNTCVVGRLNHRGETVYVLSTANILLAEERARIAAHRTMKQKRLDALATGDAYAA